MNIADRLEKGLADLRTIASVSVMHNHLPLAAECIAAALTLGTFLEAVHEEGLQDEPWIDVPRPTPPLATKGATLQALEEDLRALARSFISHPLDGLAHHAIRSAITVQNLLKLAEAHGVAGNLMMLATLTAETPRPTAG